MLMSRHDGVMASCDGVRPGSTCARVCTMTAAIGARALQSLRVRRGVRGHTRRDWATDAVHASYGRLIVLHNTGMTFARRVAVQADIEDGIIGRDNHRSWELNRGALLGILGHGCKILARQLLLGIDWKQNSVPHFV